VTEDALLAEACRTEDERTKEDLFYAGRETSGGKIVNGRETRSVVKETDGAHSITNEQSKETSSPRDRGPSGGAPLFSERNRRGKNGTDLARAKQDRARRKRSKKRSSRWKVKPDQPTRNQIEENESNTPGTQRTDFSLKFNLN
jgi:hypothetical protein